MRLGLFSYLALGVLLGCGVKKDKNNDSNESQTDDSGSKVESVGEKISTDSAQSGITILMVDTPLPECTEKNRGQTFYVTAESVFRYCDNTGVWTVVNLKGPKGDQGSTGLPSTPGANWAMYSGTTKMGKTYTNPLDIGLTSNLGITDAVYIELEQRTFLSSNLTLLSGFGEGSSLACNWYKTSDCSGPCYSPGIRQLATTGIPKPKIVASAQLWDNSNPQPLYIFDLDQIATGTFNSYRFVTPTCTNISSSPQTESAVAGYPYTIPNGVSYPLTNINFKAE